MKKKSGEEKNVPEGKEKPITSDEETHFGLAEEVKEFKNLDVEKEDLTTKGNFLQKLHLRNHSLASRETTHELYRPEEEVQETESGIFSEEDEMIFNEVKKAVTEHDIITLRNHLQFISQNVSAHTYTLEEIEDFVEENLDKDFYQKMKEDAAHNNNLARDIRLSLEINQAIQEKDILELRTQLQEISRNVNSHSRSIEEIEDYLSNELDEQARANFEEELQINAGLMKEVSLHQEINQAIVEKDIMLLREDLNRINAAEHDENTCQKRGLPSSGTKKIIWYAAASVIFLLGFNVALRQRHYSNAELYRHLYQSSELMAGISRSTSSGSDLSSQALMKMNKQDYDSALKLFATILQNDPTNAPASYYTGAILQTKGQYSNAINYFENVIKQGDNLFIEQSQWNIGLCYLKQNEKEKAIQQFKRIAEMKGYYQKKAAEVVGKLE